MPKKPDDEVGESAHPPVSGGRQTAQQAELTRTEAGGRSDRERRSEWSRGGDMARETAGHGGSSQGQSDRMPTRGGTKADNPAATPGNRHTTD